MTIEVSEQTYALLNKHFIGDSFYKQLFEELPIGYAFFKIIYDEEGNPCDYEFKDANSIFEEKTGLKRDAILCRRISEAVYSLDKNEIDKLNYNVKKTVIEGKQEFELYYRIINKWYRINLYSPKESYLIMYFIDITNEKNQLLELEHSRRRMKNIIEGTNVGTWELNLQTGEHFYNERWAEMLGYTLEELAPINDKTWHKLVYPEDLKLQLVRDEKIYNKELEFYDDEYRMIHKDGSIVWIQDRGKVISWTKDGKPHIISGTHTDITKRKNLELALAHEKNLLKTTLISVGDGVISTDNKGKIVFMNKASEQLTGWAQGEAISKPFEKVFNTINEHTREKSKSIIEKVLQTGEKHELANHTVLISKDGTERPIEDTAAPIIQENGEIVGVVLVFRDCSEKKKKQEEIIYLSYCDQLTGLYNRRYFEDKLKEIDTAENLPITLIMADVNGLKLVNDSFGHSLGDELLKKAAEVLKRGCRKKDIISRLGGDEFVAILTETSSLQAEQIIKRINSIAANEKVGAIDISISFGYETKKSMSENIQDIFKNAEDYMYRHKLYESSSIRNKTIDLIMNTLYEKSDREMLHSKRVSEICEALAVRMNFDKDKVNQIKIAGLMHDIGKMGIDENILNKPQKLNDEERKEVKRHPEIGYRILSSSNDFSEIAEYVLKHHERWDGKGYPGGFKGEEISIQARIIAIADAYDAMTSDRPYRKGLRVEEALTELKRCSGTQFDADLVDIFINMVLEKLINICC
jgi:diguanylate cyclase (GGDEF)-like protein/PAS domain S-box-containing protein